MGANNLYHALASIDQMINSARAIKPNTRQVKPFVLCTVCQTQHITSNGEEQMVLYMSGVGSEADFNGEGNAATASLRMFLLILSNYISTTTHLNSQRLWAPLLVSIHSRSTVTLEPNHISMQRVRFVMDMST